jgi:MoxR-like ATPase
MVRQVELLARFDHTIVLIEGEQGTGKTYLARHLHSLSRRSAGGKISGIEGGRGSVTQKGIGLGDFVLRIMGTKSGIDFDATLSAAAARGDAKILSRPW